jgi:tRNA uridine 5-carboxymethylaminomethyl modification enzyme
LASWRYDENPNFNFLDLLRRPDYGVQDILGLINEPLEEEILQILEIELKYEGYIRRQSSEIDRVQQYEHLRIDHLDFTAIRGLSNEVRQKLAVIRPYTLAQASRMDGITPAAIALILVHLKKKSA